MAPARPESESTPPRLPGAKAAGVTRRDALGVSARLMVGAALEATLAGCRADPPSASASEPSAQSASKLATQAASPEAASSGHFSPEQRAILDAAVDFLIPETSSPGARAAEVPAFIEGIVFEVLEEDERRAFCEGLDAVGARARAKHGQAFSRCAPEARVELVRALFAASDGAPSRGAPSDGAPSGVPEADRDLAFRKRLRELTITGFCKSRFGATRVLQYDPIPGAYDGCRSLESVGRAWATS